MALCKFIFEIIYVTGTNIIQSQKKQSILGTITTFYVYADNSFNPDDMMVRRSDIFCAQFAAANLWGLACD